MDSGIHIWTITRARIRVCRRVERDRTAICDILSALLFFNLGVETGKLLFVAVEISVMVLGRYIRMSLLHWARLAPGYAIGSLAMFWFIQRVSAF